MPAKAPQTNYPKQYLYRQIVQAKLFIDSHFSENIDLNNIADEAFFSKFHFIRLFKKIYGFTPHQYLMVVRIENSKLLLEKNISVSEVCTMVGFDSPTSFSVLFRKKTGSSPSEFQRKKLQLQAAVAEAPLQFIPGCFAEKKGWM